MGVYVLERQGVRAEIDGAGHLVRLQNMETGHDWSGKQPLWRLYYDHRHTPEGTAVAAVYEEREICIEAAEQTCEVVENERGIELHYQQLQVRGRQLQFSLTVVVSQDEDGTLRFATELKNNEPHTIVRELHCPLVTDCVLPAEAELLVTHTGGKRFKHPVSRIGSSMPLYMGPDQKFREMLFWGRTLKYPGHTASNCFAMMTETEGLYVASHDASFQDTMHLVRCLPDESGQFNRLEVGLGKYPNTMCGETWRNDCNILKPYSGDWRETAKMYRRWANSWWRKRTVPEWVAKMTGWQRIIFRHQYGETLFTPADLTGRIAAAGESAGVDTVLCFGWWRRGMDNGYPDSYFETEPAWGGDEGWRQAIADYRQRGGNFLLYFNGKLIDTESDYFQKGPGKRIAYKTNTGDIYTEQYRFSGTGTFTKQYNARTFASADHREPEWLEFLRQAVDRAIDFGCSGVFYDQLGYCEPDANWDLSGEFPVPNTRTIAAKAEALAMLRDYIEEKGLHDFAIGTENFCDCCAQSVDYMHNLIGATGPDDFTDWARYAFPECILSDREIRDDTNIPWRVNHNLLVGLRSDVEIYRCRELIDITPNYQRKLREINELRAQHPILLTGRFTAGDHLVVSTEDGLLANGFSEGDELAVVVCTPKDKAASGRVAAVGYRLVSGSDEVHLSPNGLVVLRFVKE